MKTVRPPGTHVIQWRLRPQFTVGAYSDKIWTDYAKKGPTRFGTQKDVDRHNAIADAALAAGVMENTYRLFEYRLRPEKLT